MKSRWLWTGAVFLTTAPLLVALCATLWRTPFPLSEAVALFEDVANQPPARFLVPDTAYYRPLFQLTLSTIWHNADSLDAKLAWIRMVHIVPLALLVVLFIVHVRPRTLLDAAAATLGVAVIIGSPGFRDNLELPLSYTIVGMPILLMVWMLLNRPARLWHQAAIIALTLVAVGFKEQGLVIVPLVVAAWWTRAPGARGATAATLVALAAVYVAVRVSWRDSSSMPMFEQAVGLGFGEMEPPEALARFGAFPYLIYTYSGASTIANVLFAEPTRGRFSIVRTFVYARPEPWQLVHLGSSVLLTTLIGWWSRPTWREMIRRGSSVETRVVAGFVVVLLACGALSFNYSRDRLGGMAVPLYALAAFYATRAAAVYAANVPRLRQVVLAGVLLAVAGGWQLRAVGTIERARLTAYRNQIEWLLQLPPRRIEFAERATYLKIMESMIDQGTVPDAPRPTRYPRLVQRFIAEL